MKFRRKKNADDSEAGAPVESDPTGDSSSSATEAQSDADAGEAQAADRVEESVPFDRSGGPFDTSEVEPDEERIDLGAVQVPLVEDLEVRVEVDKEGERPTGVTLVMGQGAVQVRAFAAPRSGGLWDDARDEIKTEISSSGGAVQEVSGVFGPELLAQMAGKDEAGNEVSQPIRFTAVEGPRWMLQGIFFGEGVDPEAAKAIEDVFRSVVVARGEAAMPAKQPLLIVVPEDAQAAGEQVVDDDPVPGLAAAGALNGNIGPVMLEDDDEDDDELEWIDLGSLQIPGVDGLEVRIEVDEDSKEPVAVTLIHGEGALQLRPFAAPDQGGMWDQARAEIKRDITKDGGLIDEIDGPLGRELRAKIPAEDDEGEPFIQSVRFAASEGPGWMLQGVFLGAGTDPDEGEIFQDLFQAVAVVAQPGGVQTEGPLPIILPDGVPITEEDD